MENIKKHRTDVILSFLLGMGLLPVLLVASVGWKTSLLAALIVATGFAWLAHARSPGSGAPPSYEPMSPELARAQSTISGSFYSPTRSITDTPVDLGTSVALRYHVPVGR